MLFIVWPTIPKMAEIDILYLKRLKNHTRHILEVLSPTYLYGIYMGVPPHSHGQGHAHILFLKWNTTTLYSALDQSMVEDIHVGAAAFKHELANPEGNNQVNNSVSAHAKQNQRKNKLTLITETFREKYLFPPFAQSLFHLFLLYKSAVRKGSACRVIYFLPFV